MKRRSHAALDRYRKNARTIRFHGTMHAKIRRVPKVTFLNIDGKGAEKTVEFESGKLPYDGHGKPESLLDVAMNHHIHLEHACGGSCACTTCHVWIKEGLNHVSEADEDELDRVELAPDLRPNSRLGCQMVITGDIVIEVPTWNRNYVSEGGGSLNLGDGIPKNK